MILTLDIPDTLADRLRAEAEARGEDLNNYAVAKLERPDAPDEEEEADEDLIEALRHGIADAKAGRTVSLEEAESRILAGLAARDARDARQAA